MAPKVKSITKARERDSIDEKTIQTSEKKCLKCKTSLELL